MYPDFLALFNLFLNSHNLLIKDYLFLQKELKNEA
tara:strand:+ start:102 stop:206 length:105 start_codon:yes stop_codon:yes gene_type:complete